MRHFTHVDPSISRRAGRSEANVGRADHSFIESVGNEGCLVECGS